MLIYGWCLDLEYMQTERGTKLLTSGWWGRSQHPVSSKVLFLGRMLFRLLINWLGVCRTTLATGSLRKSLSVPSHFSLIS